MRVCSFRQPQIPSAAAARNIAVSANGPAVTWWWTHGGIRCCSIHTPFDVATNFITPRCPGPYPRTASRWEWQPPAGAPPGPPAEARARPQLRASDRGGHQRPSGWASLWLGKAPLNLPHPIHTSACILPCAAPHACMRMGRHAAHQSADKRPTHPCCRLHRLMLARGCVGVDQGRRGES